MFQKPEAVNLIDDAPSKSFEVEMDETDHELGQLTISMGEDQADFEREEDNLTQLEELAESLESIHDLLGQMTNGADRTSLALAQIAIRSRARRCGIETVSLSNESIDPSLSRRQVTELSMESVVDSIKKAGTKIAEIIRKLWSAFVSFIDRIFSFFVSFGRKVEKIRAYAQQMIQKNGQAKEAQIALPKNLQHAFQVEGRTWPNVAEILKGGEYSALLQRFSSSFVAYGNTMVETLEKFTKDPRNTDKLMGAVRMSSPDAALIAAFKPAKVERADGQFTIVKLDKIPGNLEMTIRIREVNTADFPSFLRTAGRVSISSEKKGDHKPTETMPTMSLQDIVASCDGALQVCKIIEGYRKEVKEIERAKDRALRNVGLLFDSKYYKIHVSMRPGQGLFGSAFSSIMRSVMNVGATWLQHQYTLTRNVIQFAHLSLKQYQETSTVADVGAKA